MRVKGFAGLLVLLAFAAPARGDDLADFNAAIESVSAHNRVAIEYLRNGNTDLASLELDRLREAWTKVGARKRPAVFAGDPLYTVVMTDVATRLVTADLMTNLGRPENARQSLLGIRKDIYDLRKSANIVVLADCIRDANEVMDKLMAYDGRPQELRAAEFKIAVESLARSYSNTLSRCETTADERIRNDPEFRRLIDGAQASLDRIRDVFSQNDPDLLHRLLVELRSFDNLLAFRYG